MIISASRRTDVPMYYADWLFNRIRAGYAYVRNPVNPRQVSRVSLEPEAVDGIVFWTKNPAPMLDRLDALKEYMYYFQFTLTSYGQDVERHIPHKGKGVIPAFQRLSDSIGPQRVIWRYDPIFLSPVYPLEYHIRWFEILARKLVPYTRKCIVSFLDFYRDTARNIGAPGDTAVGRGAAADLGPGPGANRPELQSDPGELRGGHPLGGVRHPAGQVRGRRFAGAAAGAAVGGGEGQKSALGLRLRPERGYWGLS